MVSIIVPAYNVEKYIDKCMESIINQTAKDIEIIVVVDGATDSTYSLALAWEQRDDRVKVYFQENAGSGPARNNGLAHAKGEFVIFVDPDDWVKPEMTKELVEELQKRDVDLVTSGCISEIYDGEKLLRMEEERYEDLLISSSHELCKSYFYLFNMGAISAPTKKIYKKSIIDKYNIQFPDLRRSQDIVFNYRYYQHIESLYVTSKAYYYYRVDNAENRNKVKLSYCQSISFIFHDIKALASTWGIDKSDKEYQKFCLHFFEALVLALKNSNSAKNIREATRDSNIQQLVKEIHPLAVRDTVFKMLFIARCNHLLAVALKINALIKG